MSVLESPAASPMDAITAVLSGRMSERARKILTAYLLGGAAFAAGRRLHTKARERLEFTVSIKGNDDIFPDVQAWLLDLIPEERRRSLGARSARHLPTNGYLSVAVSDSPAQPDPDPQRLWLAYDGSRDQTVTIKGHRVRVSVANSVEPGGSDEESWMKWLHNRESIKFSASTLAGRRAVVDFLTEIARVRHTTDRTPDFYLASQWGGWDRRNDLPKRPVETVVLPPGQMERLIDDLQQFRDSEAAYNRLGVPYHRGYLLHGPPGSGKTSIAKALAHHFAMDVYYLPLSDMTADTKLLQVVSAVTAGSMLLLEDIDVLHSAHQRESGTGDEANRLSLSGLLNALDGVASPHGMIVIATTNNLAQLDSALVRVGRFDVTERIGWVTDAQLSNLFRMAYGYEPTPSLPSIRMHTSPETWYNREITAAQVVDIIKRNLDNDVAAYSEITQLLEPVEGVRSGRD